MQQYYHRMMSSFDENEVVEETIQEGNALLSRLEASARLCELTMSNYHVLGH